MSESRTVQPVELPTTIREYLAAHAASDADTAVRAFAPDAVVVDEGRTYRGTAEVLAFLDKAGSQYSYTTELTGGRYVDDERWEAVDHLEGDLPGGVVDLIYRFTLTGDRIAELVIVP